MEKTAKTLRCKALPLSIALSLLGAVFANVADADPQFYPGTGHYYDFIVSSVQGTPSWQTAKDEAEAMGGYLVTVTSAGEQAFLEDIRPMSGAWWSGGSDAAVEGVWRWMTGPEAGTQFWQGFSNGNTTPPDNYANWLPGEPNSTVEDYMSWNANTQSQGWNDVGITNSAIRGFIVEYDAAPVPVSPATWGEIKSRYR